jgi:hypothetical protein
MSGQHIKGNLLVDGNIIVGGDINKGHLRAGANGRKALNAVGIYEANAVDIANSLIADMASDGKLTAVEKIALRREWNIIAAEKAGLDAQATSLGLTALKLAYDTAAQDLADYLNAGTTWGWL